MKLYYIETMNPRKACATAKQLRSPVEYVKLELGPRGMKSPEYLAINPNGAAPTLVDGSLTLWESAAICAHLAAKAGSDMWPTRDVAEQIEVLRWISWDAFHWMRAVGPFYFEHFIKPTLIGQEPDRHATAAITPGFHKHARILDDHLAGKSFVACNRLTIADFCLDAMLPGWESLEVPLQEYANIRRWHENLMNIDAWRDPWPK